MASQPRRKISTLVDALAQETCDFEFHQAVKILEQLSPEANPLGEGVSVQKEVAQIKSRISLSSPASDIYALDESDPLSPPTLHINFWGIAGLQGPLPIAYTELILERLRHKDLTIKEFLDIFNHRLVAISHRIKKKHIPALNTLRPNQTMLGQCLHAFTGTTTTDTTETLGIPPQSLLYYSGLLWQHPQSPAGLKVILEHYFSVPFSIKSFEGRWLKLDLDESCRIGKNGQYNSLGNGAMLGTKVWDSTTQILLRIGPLDKNTFHQFLKTGSAYKALLKLTKFYLPDHYRTKLNLVVKAQDVCPTQLNGKSQLGWTTWLKSKESLEDDDQVLLFPD